MTVVSGGTDHWEGTEEVAKEGQGDGKLGDGERITNDSLKASHDPGQAFGVENNCGEAKVDVPGLDNGEVSLDGAICLAGGVLRRDPLNEEGL